MQTTGNATPYIGRFAPSPTGPLHAGSVVAALGSWLDARAHGGRWLVRIEDIDTERCRPEHAHEILRQLHALGLQPDAPPVWQRSRLARHRAKLDALRAAGGVYACGCTRRAIDEALQRGGQALERHRERVYPGTCRPDRPHATATAAAAPGVAPEAAAVRHWRLAVQPLGAGAPLPPVHWHDRRLGPQQQDVARAVGDFSLAHGDGSPTYQLAMTVDDADAGVTDIVRGEDLADNTARQLLLRARLGLPAPRHLHLPLVRAADGEKLSKQHGAPATPVDTPEQVRAALQQAARHLGLPLPPSAAAAPHQAWLAEATAAWAERWVRPNGVAGGDR